MCAHVRQRVIEGRRLASRSKEGVRGNLKGIMAGASGRTSTRLLAVALAIVVSVFAAPARADSRTEFLIARLASDDFRVRTNAALALGATNDDSAVQPLCGVLDDASEVVRQASAVALKRLMKPASVGCLKKHLDTEKNDSVKLQLSRAVEAIEAAGGAPTGDDPGAGDAPKTNAGAKYYVAIAPVTNNSSRAQADVDRIVGASVRAKLEALGQYQVAPSKESADAARAVLQKRKLKGFYITLALDKLDYGQDGLKVTVKVVVFNYPNKAMQGVFDKWKLMPGVRPGDKSAEETLIAATAAAAIDTFAQNAGSF
jgi:HEAT repeats